MVKIRTKSGEEFEVSNTYDQIQRSITNNRAFIELQLGDGSARSISPTSIESVTRLTREGDSVYKANARNAKFPSNFPFPMSAEETAAAQAKLQPMKVFFDQKKEAMLEMKAKEDAAMNAAYQTRYGGYLHPTPKTEVPSLPSLPQGTELAPARKAGRPKNTLSKREIIRAELEAEYQAKKAAHPEGV